MAKQNEIRVHISAENQEFVNKMKEIIDLVKDTKTKTEQNAPKIPEPTGLVSGLVKAGIVAGSVYMALSQLKSLASSIVMPGWNYTTAIQQSRLGMSGILQAMGQINDETIDFNTALSISDYMIEKLQRDAIKTAANAKELINTFQALLGPGLGAGMNLDQIETVAVKGVNALKSIMPNAPDLERQFVQELRDLMQGGIQAGSSTLATALGLTDKDINEAKASTEGLFKFLMDRIQGFDDAALAFPKTLIGSQDQFKEVFERVSGTITKAFESEIISIYQGITKLLAEINQETGEVNINPAILKTVSSLKEGFSELANLSKALAEQFGAFDDDGTFYFSEEALQSFDTANGFLSDIWKFVLDIGSLLVSLTPIIEEIVLHVGEWYDAIIKVVSIIIDVLIGGIDNANESFGTTKIIIDIIVDTLMGFLIIEKIITVVQGMQTAFNLVKTAVLGVREAIKATSIAQAALNVLTGAMGGPAGIAVALAGTAAAVAAGYALSESGIFDFGGIGSTNDSDTQNTFQDLLVGLKKGDGKTSDFGNITSKWGNSKADEKAEKEAIKQSQKELKRAIDSISDWAKSANKDIDDQIEALKIKNNQSPMDPKEFYSQLYTLEQQKAINTEIAIQEKVSATNNALFKDEADRIGALQEYQREAEDAAKATGKLTNSLSEITGTMQTAIAGFNEEGTTWRREVAGVNIEGLNDVATNAISLLSQKFFELTGKQMVVSSGLRDWGGHVSGNKFDVVDDYSSTLLEDNVNGIRDAIIQYAQSIGLDVLDEYTNPSARATAGHLDFDATNFTGQINQYMTWRAGDMLTKGGEEYRKAIQALFDEGNKLLMQAAKTIDNGNFLEKVEISNKYDELAKKFKAANMNHVVDAIEKIRSTELLNIDFAQTQKDLEYANEELAEYQEQLFNKMVKGSLDAGNVTQAYINKYHEVFDGYLEELQKQLDEAMKLGDKSQISSIKKQIKETFENLTNGIEENLKRINDEIDAEIAEINANRKMTKMQKQDALDNAERRKYANEANELRKKANQYRKEDNRNGDNKHDYNIKQLEREASLKDKLAEIPSLLDKIHEASTQAFEDGLLNFLERGIFECENLGEAFKELAITILQSMQKVFSEDLTKNIMTGLGFGDRYKKKEEETDLTSQAANLSGMFGNITNETTGFLTSFDGQMMQFAQQAQVAFQNILQTISSAANAIPSYFPILGSSNTPSTSGGTGNFYQSQYGIDYSSVPKFAEGGAISQDGKITGPGTGTSDSILAWVSNGERIVDAATVKKWGHNFFERLKTGDIYNMHIPIPKFARGGAIGKVAANAAMQGLTSFSQELGTNISPTFNNTANVRIDGGQVANVFRDIIKADIKSHVEKEMVQNSKRNSMIMKKMW